MNKHQIVGSFLGLAVSFGLVGGAQASSVEASPKYLKSFDSMLLAKKAEKLAAEEATKQIATQAYEIAAAGQDTLASYRCSLPQRYTYSSCHGGDGCVEKSGTKTYYGNYSRTYRAGARVSVNLNVSNGSIRWDSKPRGSFSRSYGSCSLTAF